MSRLFMLPWFHSLGSHCENEQMVSQENTVFNFADNVGLYHHHNQHAIKSQK